VETAIVAVAGGAAGVLEVLEVVEVVEVVDAGGVVLLVDGELELPHAASSSTAASAPRIPMARMELFALAVRLERGMRPFPRLRLNEGIPPRPTPDGPAQDATCA
jgi:hypothetical protein